MESWRERANRRKNERRTAVPDIRPPGGSKKNTKKWCRGKVGVVHVPVCKSYAEAKRFHLAADWKVLVCEKCGKELDYWWPSPWFKTSKPKPAWVVE